MDAIYHGIGFVKKWKKIPNLKQLIEPLPKKDGKLYYWTRLSPVFPFNLLNYAFGVTQVSFKDYLLGSLGIIPATVIYVYIGSIAGNLATMNISNQPSNPRNSNWTMGNASNWVYCHRCCDCICDKNCSESFK